jgi:hypothetical protein
VNPYQSPSESGCQQPPAPKPTRGYSLRRLLLVLGAIPLLFCPVVLPAVIMGLAAPRTAGDEPTNIFGIAILVGSLAYPVVYCPCDWVSESLNEKSKSERLAEALSFVPLVYLSVVSLLFLAAGWADTASIGETNEERWEKYGKKQSLDSAK